jgi:hypothetical protein
VIRLLAKLIELVHPSAGHSDSRVFLFLRGLALGALVGAAIAGSSIWKRTRDLETHERSGDDTGRD